MIDLFNQGLNTKQIAKELGVFRKTVGKYLRKNGCKYSKHNKCDITSDIFEIIDNEEKAYWLGFLYADGNVTDRGTVELSLKLSDKKHLEKFRDFLSFKGKIYTDSFRCRLMFKDSKISQDLIKQGCLKRKSLILQFPEDTQIPDKLLSHFIRGYFDGDGHIRKKGSITIDLLGTEQFLKSLLLKTDICSTVKKTESKAYSIRLCGDRARKFCKIIYENCVTSLDRKYEVYKNRINDFKR